MFVERFIQPPDEPYESFVLRLHRAIKGGILAWKDNTHRLPSRLLRQQAEEWKSAQASNGHPDVWNLPAWRKNFLP